MNKSSPSVNIFISSSEKDIEYKDELIRNLYSLNENINILSYQGNFESFDNKNEIIPSLIRSADLFLLLITPRYPDSKFANTELELILERDKDYRKWIIPIIFEPAKSLPLKITRLISTPRNGMAVSEYKNKHEAYSEINDTINSAIESDKNLKVQNILNEVKNSKNDSLDLSKCNLGLIPFDIMRMPWLKKLFLSNNQITRISNLDNLADLEHLDLSFNSIEQISGISKLVNLRSLNIAHNKISEIRSLESLHELNTLDLYENSIERIENLENNTNLQFLGLSNNQLKELNNISHLSKLEKLFASYNKIRDLQGISSMKSLKRIVLTNNNIESLQPIISLIESGLPVRLKYSFDLDEKGIFIKDNTSLSNPSVEVIESGNDAILKYFRDADIHGTEKLEILKLILVGNSRVGKTNLSEFFRTGKINADSQSTHILDIKPWDPPFLRTQNNTLMHLNIFDFGGQDYYHDSHRIYYTHDTAYILLWDTLTNLYSEVTDENTPGEKYIYENFPLEYWLESINYNLEGKALNYYKNPAGTNTSANSPKVPVFILQNKIDITEGKLNQNELSRQYPNIWGYFNVSLLAKKRTSILIEVLDDYLRELNLSGRVLIKFEINIVNRFLSNPEPLRIITLDEFWKECRETINDPTIEFNRDNAAIMAQILNNIGLVLYDKTDENKGNIYTNITELNEIIKDIMDVARKGSDKGLFSKSQLNDMKFTDEILALLSKNNSIIQINADYFLAPQFLPVKPDTSIEFFLHAFTYCQMRFLYKAYFHKTLLLNLFAKYLKDTKTDLPIGIKSFPFWRNGIIVSRGEGNSKELVLVEFVKTSDMGIVNIKTMKPFSDRGLEKEIEKTLDELNKGWTVEKQISVDSTEFFGVKDLEEQVKGKQFVFYRNSKSFTINDFKRLYEFINLPKKLFISYSSKNADFISRFATHLQILKSNGLIEPWYDRMIESGTRWDDAIRTEMKRADVIIFLLSPDFIATDYIMKTEIPLAIEQFGNEKAKFFFIQLLPCAWQKTRLNEFQQTDNPGEKEKNVITIDRPDNDRKWNTVIDELEAKLKA